MALPSCSGTALAIHPVLLDPNGTLPTDPSLAQSVFVPGGGNAIEIFGALTAGAGRLYLMRCLALTSTDWYVIDDDAQDLKSLQVDSTKPTALPGQFSGVWLTGDRDKGGGAAAYVVFSTAELTGKLYAMARRI